MCEQMLSSSRVSPIYERLSKVGGAKRGKSTDDPLSKPLGIEGEDESWDFGTGAGFYVDATAEPWAANYRMYSYVTQELPEIIKANFNVNQSASIMGHRYWRATRCFCRERGHSASTLKRF